MNDPENRPTHEDEDPQSRNRPVRAVRKPSYLDDYVTDLTAALDSDDSTIHYDSDDSDISEGNATSDNSIPTQAPETLVEEDEGDESGSNETPVEDQAAVPASDRRVTRSRAGDL